MYPNLIPEAVSDLIHHADEKDIFLFGVRLALVPSVVQLHVHRGILIAADLTGIIAVR